MKRQLLPLVLLASLAPVSAQNTTVPTNALSEKTPLALIASYNQALQKSDAAALDQLFASDYTEVSPLGEVDDRKKVLGVYREAAGKPSGLAEIVLEEPLVRTYGNIAVVVAKESFVLEGGVRRSLRATFVCRLQNQHWQLVSAHVTAIRPPLPSKPK